MYFYKLLQFHTGDMPQQHRNQVNGRSGIRITATRGAPELPGRIRYTVFHHIFFAEGNIISRSLNTVGTRGSYRLCLSVYINRIITSDACRKSQKLTEGNSSFCGISQRECVGREVSRSKHLLPESIRKQRRLFSHEDAGRNTGKTFTTR